MNIDGFESLGDSYKAADDVLKKLDADPSIVVEPHPREKYNYYLNENRKTALFSKCVSKLSKRSFEKQYYKSENKKDKTKSCTTTLVGKNGISYFMNEGRFAEYSLAVDCGSLTHEIGLFFKKIDGKLHVIYFNPNFSDCNDGVESSQVVNVLLRKLASSIASIRAYYSPTGNVESKCAAITWQELYSHVWKGTCPFNRNDIALEDYNHLTTLFNYKKYWFKKTQPLPADEYKTWVLFDQQLAVFNSPLAICEISKEIIAAVQKITQPNGQ